MFGCTRTRPLTRTAADEKDGSPRVLAFPAFTFKHAIEKGGGGGGGLCNRFRDLIAVVIRIAGSTGTSSSSSSSLSSLSLPPSLLAYSPPTTYTPKVGTKVGAKVGAGQQAGCYHDAWARVTFRLKPTTALSSPSSSSFVFVNTGQPLHSHIHTFDVCVCSWGQQQCQTVKHVCYPFLPLPSSPPPPAPPPPTSAPAYATSKPANTLPVPAIPTLYAGSKSMVDTAWP